jgi:hypothetical protein
MKEWAHKTGGVVPICGASLAATTCHRSHRNSRGTPSPSYRNPIKISGATAAFPRLSRSNCCKSDSRSWEAMLALQAKSLLFGYFFLRESVWIFSFVYRENCRAGELGLGAIMKKVVLASMALAALLATPARAAEVAVKAPVYQAAPVLPYNWSGPYLGINVGGGWSRNPFVLDNPAVNLDFLEGGGAVGRRLHRLQLSNFSMVSCRHRRGRRLGTDKTGGAGLHDRCAG